ncbi:uncharacterized protein LOC122510983 isoform X1 [Leptopilina heterotoma]|uniref:uncharacterized protein LOC122510983 isoform X1 n=1 Tax=Leptopilina heterotoma TaxID=63436 RepID=UPI001CA8FCC4|nr:uncharacterized protein LOC122510983 isoform X1 [Leptopilina heterotoma]
MQKNPKYFLLTKYIQTFLNDAPDLHDLDKKVIAIFGIFGALRGDELVKVTTKDVERQGSLYLIKVRVTKNLNPQSFVIPEQFSSYLEKYINLRPKNVTTDRFFLNYQSGKCTVQVIGKNKIAKVPQKIAQFLKLEDYKNYTGHSFRRSSATILVDAGANMTTLRRLGGWKSDAVAQGYIEESMYNKTEISNMFSKTINGPSSSKQTPIDVSSSKRLKIDDKNTDESDEPSEFLPKDTSLQEKKFKFENCNITMHFNN